MTQATQPIPLLETDGELETTLAPEAFVEEINLLSLEGWLFCFDRREAGRRQPGVYEHPMRDGAVLQVELSRYGQPGILAYRVMQAIFRKITQEGFPYPDRVTFTRYALSNLLAGAHDSENPKKYRYSSKDGKELEDALWQLRRTNITIRGSKTFQFADDFSVLQRLVLVYDDEAIKGTRAPFAFYAVLNDAIKDSMDKGHIAIFNWAVLERLEPMESALYKRLYFNLANILESAERQGTDTRSLQIKKNYASICREWLGGLTVHRYRSQVEQQLGPTLLQLKKVGFLRSYTVEPNAKGDGFNITFRPGRQFYKDYELLFKTRYRPQLQFENATNRVEFSEPIELVLAFYQKLKGQTRNADSVTNNEITLAKDLLARLGAGDAYALIDYALSEAKRTKWDVQRFQALSQYVDNFIASKEARAQASVAMAEAEAARIKQALQNEYEGYLKDHTSQYLNSLSPEELAAMTARVEARIPNKSEQSAALLAMGIRIGLRALAQEVHPPLSYDDWLAAKRGSVG